MVFDFSTTRSNDVGLSAFYASVMPRVLMNFQLRDGWHVHFIEADNPTFRAFRNNSGIVVTQKE